MNIGLNVPAAEMAVRADPVVPVAEVVDPADPDPVSRVAQAPAPERQRARYDLSWKSNLPSSSRMQRPAMALHFLIRITNRSSFVACEPS